MTNDSLPYITLSPSFPLSSTHNILPRNLTSNPRIPNIAFPLNRKILKIDLSEQSKGILNINIVNLFAYLISDLTIYDYTSTAHLLSNIRTNTMNTSTIIHDFMLDFERIIDPYLMKYAKKYSNDHLDQFRSNINHLLFRNTNNNRTTFNEDYISYRTKLRNEYREQYNQQMQYHDRSEQNNRQRISRICKFLFYDIFKILLYSLTFILFPIAIILIFLISIFNVLVDNGRNSYLPLSSTMCIVRMECPHKKLMKKIKKKKAFLKTKHKLKKKYGFSENTVLFLESNGDVYHKILRKDDVFYIRGQSLIAFDVHVRIRICNYGKSGVNLLDYRMRGEYLECKFKYNENNDHIECGHIWYGNGKQDLQSNAYKIGSLLFMDNMKYFGNMEMKNFSELAMERRRRRIAYGFSDNGSGNNDLVINGYYNNGRYGIIQSFEMREYVSNSVTSVICLERFLMFMSFTVLVVLVVSLFVTFVVYDLDGVVGMMDGFIIQMEQALERMMRRVF